MNCINRMIKWDITYNCNLRCRHCYNSKYFVEKQEELSNIRIFDLFLKFKEMKVSRVHLLGGEPLLSPYLPLVLHLCKKNNMVSTLTTNGTLLTNEMVRFLFDMDVQTISISLDGVTEESNDYVRGKNVFKTVIQNIRKCMEIKKEVRARTLIFITLTLTQKNIEESSSFLEFAYDLGVDGILIAPVDQQGNAIENWKNIGITPQQELDAYERIVSHKEYFPNTYLEIVCKYAVADFLYKKYGFRNRILDKPTSFCNGTDEEYYIQPDGTIYPCHSCSDIENYKIQLENKCDITLAPNVFKDSAIESMTNIYLKNFFEYSRNIGIYKRSYGCENCFYSTRCLPCPLKINMEYSSPICELAKQRFEIYKNDVFGKNIKISEHVVYDGLLTENVKILNVKTQEEIEGEGIVADIFEMLNNRKSISVKLCVEQLYELYQSSVEYDELKQDFIDCVIELCLKGYVTIC